MIACDDEVIEETNFEEIGLTPQEKAIIAKINIDRYFKDKNIIREVDFGSPKYTNLVWNTNICDAVNLAYKAIEKSGRFSTKSSEHSISEDIRLVIKILGKMKKYVPQEFSAGMLLMHLELIEGIEF